MLSFILGIIVGLLVGWWIWGRAAAHASTHGQGDHGHDSHGHDSHGHDSHGHDDHGTVALAASEDRGLTDVETITAPKADEMGARTTPLIDTGDAIAPTGVPDVGGDGTDVDESRASAFADDTIASADPELLDAAKPSPAVSSPTVSSPTVSSSPDSSLTEPGTLTPAAIVGASSAPMEPIVSPATPPAARGPLIDAAAQERARAIGITPAREGAHGDDLQRVRGIGPKLETMLQDLGVYTFDQMADWTDEEIDRVNDNLTAFKGRIRRDDWRAQAKDLR